MSGNAGAGQPAHAMHAGTEPVDFRGVKNVSHVRGIIATCLHGPPS